MYGAPLTRAARRGIEEEEKQKKNGGRRYVNRERKNQNERQSWEPVGREGMTKCQLLPCLREDSHDSLM